MLFDTRHRHISPPPPPPPPREKKKRSNSTIIGYGDPLALSQCLNLSMSLIVDIYKDLIIAIYLCPSDEYRLLGPGRQLLRRGPPSLWGIGNVGGVTGSLANLADDVKKGESLNSNMYTTDNHMNSNVSQYWPTQVSHG